MASPQLLFKACGELKETLNGFEEGWGLEEDIEVLYQLHRQLAAAQEQLAGQLARHQAGNKVPAPETKILCFYGHGKGRPYAEFSNFYWHGEPGFTFRLPDFARRDSEGFAPIIQCQFSEKAIMATKASLMGDLEKFQEIVASNWPDDVKAKGREVRNWNEALWMQHLEEIALQVVLQKFTSSKQLEDLLLGTGERVIAEAAPTDYIWGIGMRATDPRCQDRAQWQGTNHLGFALMEARKRIRAAGGAA
mmetsp:Transcript_11938/g.27884  ORF Transcript_11938/g.27884 Transcript_11938/m.27884 type:complete len:249 (+) Transcript_11938:72-818(+)